MPANLSEGATRFRAATGACRALPNSGDDTAAQRPETQKRGPQTQGGWMGVGPARGGAARVTRGTGWPAVAVVLVVVSTILGGCSGVTQPVAADLTGPRSGPCPQEYPRRLHVARLDPAGSPPVRGLHACTSDPRRGPVLLLNAGSTVWATV